MDRIWWVVVAAGSSTRMGRAGAKMWLQIGERPVMAWVLHAIVQAGPAYGGVVVVRPEDVERTKRLVASTFPETRWMVEVGGKTRAESVRRGLQAIMSDGGALEDLVLIHDGARPLIDSALVARVVEAAASDGAAVPLVAVADTVKQVGVAGTHVLETVDRQHLGFAQTPQGFRLGAIWEAHRRLGPDAVVTDDAEVMERLQHPVRVVLGDARNRKITTPEDVAWVRWQLADRGDNVGEPSKGGVQG